MIRGGEFFDKKFFGSKVVYSGADFYGSTFTRCDVGQFEDPEYSLVVRDFKISRCKIVDCSLQGVYFDKGVVEDVSISRGEVIYGCVFDQVKLKGRVGALLVTVPHFSQKNRDSMIDGIISRYESIEWALDISEAQFVDVDLFGIPGDLIRHDGNTQVLIKRDLVESFYLNQPKKDVPIFADVWMSRFEVSPFDHIICVAPRRSKRFSEYMRSIEWMHNKGLTV